MHIGERIKQSRLEKGKTLLDVANMLGVAEATVQRYESGEIKNLKLTTIQNIASYLNADPAYLMGWKETPENLGSYSEYDYLPVDIAAGLPENVESITSSEIGKINLPDSVMGKWAGNKDISIMRVNGESMNKTIPHNSLIAVKSEELCNLKNEDIVVYSDSYEYSVKRLLKQDDRLIFRPHSTDLRYTDYIVTTDDSNLRIYGKVVVYIVIKD